MWWRRRFDEIERRIAAIETRLTAVNDAASQAGSKPAPTSDTVTVKLLDTVAMLTDRMIGRYEAERERARQQRIQARAAGIAKERQQHTLALDTTTAAPPVPEAFLRCEECMSTLEQRQPAHNRDMMLHSQHKQLFWDWLSNRNGSTDPATAATESRE